LKKEAKNFWSLGALAKALPRPAVSRSFFASFFSKKEVLAYLCIVSAWTARFWIAAPLRGSQ
jgi:hypothetical protein